MSKIRELEEMKETVKTLNEEIAKQEIAMTYRFDKNGYDSDGFNHEGFNLFGRDADDYSREGYDRHGYDRKGLNSFGYDEAFVNSR